MRSKITLLFLSLVLFTGCVSSEKAYTPPPAGSAATIQKSKEVDRSREDVWTALVSGLSSQFFVVNNMDKASGFINVSYSGDPEKYVDGGELVFKVSNLREPREYRFPAATANSQYEVFQNGVLIGVQRHLSLEGRMNVVVSESAPGKTKVTVNTRYVLTLNSTMQSFAGQPIPPYTGTISFNTGEEAKFPSGTTFRSTGALEAAALALVK